MSEVQAKVSISLHSFGKKKSSAFSFSFLFYAVLPPRCQLFCGKSVKYKFIEFFVFDCDSLPYLLSLYFLVASYFSLVALDKIA